MTADTDLQLLSLAKLAPGCQGVVRSLHAEENFALRLAAMGFRVGRSVTVVRQAPLGGPLQVRIGTTDIMLRRTEADRIDISLL